MKAKKTPNSRTYTGHSGQMAVMAELLFRECNVSIPDVDAGTDVFAFLDDREEVARIQVKTAQGTRYKDQDGYSAQFSIPLKQLQRDDLPPLHYAFAVRLDGRWADFLVIRRPELRLFQNGDVRFGTENMRSDSLVLTVQFREGMVLCGEVNLTDYLNAWHRLPTFTSVSTATSE